MADNAAGSAMGTPRERPEQEMDSLVSADGTAPAGALDRGGSGDGTFKEFSFGPLRPYRSVNQLRISFDPDMRSAQRRNFFGDGFGMQDRIIGQRIHPEKPN